MYMDKQVSSFSHEQKKRARVPIVRAMRGQNQSINPGLVIQIVDDAAFRPSLPFTFLLGSSSALRFIDWFCRLFLLGHLDELLEVVPHVLGVVEE